jgi:hypothetical protein
LRHSPDSRSTSYGGREEEEDGPGKKERKKERKKRKILQKSFSRVRSKTKFVHRLDDLIIMPNRLNARLYFAIVLAKGPPWNAKIFQWQSHSAPDKGGGGSYLLQFFRKLNFNAQQFRAVEKE